MTALEATWLGAAECGRIPCMRYRFDVHHSLVLLAAACVTACARPAPEHQIVEDAAAALGGRQRILAARTLSLQAAGSQWNLGQDMTPEAASQTFAVTMRRMVDLAAARARVEQTRTPNFEYFQGRAPQKRVTGVDGEIGYDITPDGRAGRIPNAPARDRRTEIYHHPLTIVRAALDPATKLSNPRAIGGERAVAVATAGGLNFTLAIDDSTKLPTRVVSMASNPVLGDVAIETIFGEYQDVSGLRLPAHLTTKTDRFTTADLRVTSQTLDGDVGDLAAPSQVPRGPGVDGPPPATVTVEEAAKGVWFLAGQSHHSVLIEFDDHLALFEAPNEARTLAVIARARELRPNKPLTHVINSHHHFDHSGGIRTAIAEGLAVITHKANEAFYRDLVERSRTIAPDALSKNPKPLRIETVDDELVLKDEGMEMRLYHIAGNPHGDAMLMAYLPRQRLLIEADAYSPGSTYQPYAANLLENLRRRNLRVDRIVPVHGTIVPFSELVKAVRTTATN